MARSPEVSQKAWSHKSFKDQGTEFPHRMWTLWFQTLPIRNWKNKFLLFYTTKFVLIYYRSPRKLFKFNLFLIGPGETFGVYYSHILLLRVRTEILVQFTEICFILVQFTEICFQQSFSARQRKTEGKALKIIWLKS